MVHQRQQAAGEDILSWFYSQLFCEICNFFSICLFLDNRLFIRVLSRKSILAWPPAKEIKSDNGYFHSSFSCSQAMCLYLVILECKFSIFFKILHFDLSCVE